MKHLLESLATFAIIGGLLFLIKYFSNFETMVLVGITLILMNTSWVKQYLRENL